MNGGKAGAGVLDAWVEKESGIAADLGKARRETDTEPTEGQIGAGNYSKGRLRFHGIPIAIENPKGSVRSGTDSSGKKWSTKMKHDYGYFTGTRAVDGDAVDCFIGPDLDSPLVVAVDQEFDGKYDETKFVLGARTREEGEKIYLSNYEKGWKLGPVSTCTVDQLKKWLKEGDHKKPFAGQLLKAAGGEFVFPENYDTFEKYDRGGFKLVGGGDDWEISPTRYWVVRNDPKGEGELAWMNVKGSEDAGLDETAENKERIAAFKGFSEKARKAWVAEARRLSRDRASDLGSTPSLEFRDFKKALESDGMTPYVGSSGTKRIKAASGRSGIRAALERVDLDELEEKARSMIASGKSGARKEGVKLLRAVTGMRRSGAKPTDLLIRKVPVIPPAFRPFTVAGDTFIPGDANELYSDLIRAVQVQKEAESELGPEGAAEARKYAREAVKAVYGYGETPNPKMKARKISGFLAKLLGKRSKESWVSAKLVSKPQDFTARGVISPDPELGLDEIGLPEDVAWSLYHPHVQKRLVASGVPVARALVAIRDRTPVARKQLEMEMRERPVVYSRAPAWHKFNVLAGFPKIADGENIKINTFVTTGLNADFDGDTIGIHAPILPETVREAKEKLMPSKMLFSIRSRDKVMPQPKHEQLLGLFSTQMDKAKKTVRFRTEDEALEAIRKGDLDLSDDVEIG